MIINSITKPKAINAVPKIVNKVDNNHLFFDHAVKYSVALWEFIDTLSEIVGISRRRLCPITGGNSI